MFILATTEPHRIPATILSRCQRYEFRRIPVDSITVRLAEIAKSDGIAIDASGLETIASLADGALRDAISLLDQAKMSCAGTISRDDILALAGLAKDDALLELAQALILREASPVLDLVDQLVMAGRDLARLIPDLAMLFRNLLICQVSNRPEKLVQTTAEGLATMRQLATLATQQQLLAWIRGLSSLLTDLRWATDTRTVLEVGLLRLMTEGLADASGMTVLPKSSAAPVKSAATAVTALPKATAAMPVQAAPTPIDPVSSTAVPARPVPEPAPAIKPAEPAIKLTVKPADKPIEPPVPDEPPFPDEPPSYGEPVSPDDLPLPDEPPFPDEPQQSDEPFYMAQLAETEQSPPADFPGKSGISQPAAPTAPASPFEDVVTTAASAPAAPPALTAVDGSATFDGAKLWQKVLNHLSDAGQMTLFLFGRTARVEQTDAHVLRISFGKTEKVHYDELRSATSQKILRESLQAITGQVFELHFHIEGAPGSASSSSGTRQGQAGSADSGSAADGPRQPDWITKLQTTADTFGIPITMED